MREHSVNCENLVECALLFKYHPEEVLKYQENRHMDVELTNGVITDYDDFFLWVESLEENAKASVIAKDEDGEAVSITEAEIVKIVDRSDFDSEEEYEEASDDLGSDEDIDTMAEFMTADGIFYVGVRHVGEERPLESFEIGDGVYYC